MNNDGSVLTIEKSSRRVGSSTAAAERLAEAVRCRTISAQDLSRLSPGEFHRLHDFLREAYPNVHDELRRDVIGGLSLVYEWPGTDSTLKPILLSSHLDVVPVETATEERWTHPPFAGDIADGYVWGRGSIDDKAAVLGTLEAVEHLVAAGFRPRRTIYLAFGHDEEVGGHDGAAQIAARLRARGVSLECVFDEGLVIGHGLLPEMASPVAMIGIAEKGYATFELTATADGGHASMPPAHTAIGTLSGAIHRIETHPMPARMPQPIRQLFAAVAPHMPLMERLVFGNLWLLEPLLRHRLARAATTNATIRTTGAVTMIEGGTKENVLPTGARALANFRILTGDSIARVAEHLERVIDDPRVRVRQLSGQEPSPVADSDSTAYRTLAATIRQTFPDVTVAPGLVIAGTDAKHYVGVSDAVYRFRPLRLGREDLPRVHGIDERIAVDNYAEAIDFYGRLLRNFAS